MLLVGRQEGHAACKNWVVGCYHGYLSGARCRLAYGPADASATAHSLSLASVKSWLVLPFWYRLNRVVPEKWPLNGCVCVCVCVLYHLRDIASFISKFADFIYPICICCPSWAWSNFKSSFWRQKTGLSCGVVCRCLRDSTFGQFDTVPACGRERDRQTNKGTDGRTYKHTTTAYTALPELAPLPWPFRGCAL